MRQDDRFADNPLVAGEPGVRFYAGFPLRLRDGASVGSLCLIDYAPREFSAADLAVLVTWARWLRMSLPPSARRPRMS